MSKVVRIGRDPDDERFADALEHGSDSGEFADELAVAAMLRAASSTPMLDAAGRDRILAKIDAAEQNPPAVGRARRVRRWPIGTAAAASVLAVCALGLELSRDALPGDALYDVKRAAESVSMGLTFSDNGRTAKYLESAQARIDELAALAERDVADGGADVAETAQYHAVLGDFDRSVTAASAQITENAVARGGQGLRSLGSWSERHGEQLSALSPQLPDAVANSASSTVTLLGDIASRSDQLIQRLHCDEVSEGTDTLGAVPADTVCSTASSKPTSSTQRSEKPTPTTSAKDSATSEPTSPRSTAPTTQTPTPDSAPESDAPSQNDPSVPNPQRPPTESVDPPTKPKLPLPKPSLPRPSSDGLDLPTPKTSLPGVGPIG